MKPLTLKQERAKKQHAPAAHLPYATVLVDHGVVHLPATYQYLVPEEFSDAVAVGVLVEVEFGSKLCAGIVTERVASPSITGSLKYLEKVLSRIPYVVSEQLQLIETVADAYGTGIWDILRSTVPPFSVAGERTLGKLLGPRSFLSQGARSHLPPELANSLAHERNLHAAITLAPSHPYWKVLADIVVARLTHGEPFSKVLVVTPNDRELALLEGEFHRRGLEPIVLSTQQGKSERYANYLLAQQEAARLIIGTRSSALLALPQGSTIILQDDVDESHYERAAPTWNSRKLISLRESQHSTLFVSATLSLEIAQRIAAGNLKHYTFPIVKTPKIMSASTQRAGDFFPVIKRGLAAGSVLVSVARAGYISTFSCQKCRNIALCSCGGRLFFSDHATQALCSICTTPYPNWECAWCKGSKPRIVSSGALRIAEELGPAFPGVSILKSTGETPVPTLPSGNHLVISTSGVEPRGEYSAQVFLGLEAKLLRTQMRSSEEVRYEVLRTLTMLKPGGEIYLDLLNDDPFVQMLMRRKLFETAVREIEERDGADLPPNFVTAVITAPNLSSITLAIESLPDVKAIGPYQRRNQTEGLVSMLLKIPSASAGGLIKVLGQINRVRSAKKEPLLTYRIAPYDLDS